MLSFFFLWHLGNYRWEQLAMLCLAMNAQFAFKIHQSSSLVFQEHYSVEHHAGSKNGASKKNDLHCRGTFFRSESRRPDLIVQSLKREVSRSDPA